MTLWSYRILAAGDRYLKAGEEPGGRIGASMRKDRMKKPYRRLGHFSRLAL